MFLWPFPGLCRLVGGPQNSLRESSEITFYEPGDPLDGQLKPTIIINILSLEMLKLKWLKSSDVTGSKTCYGLHIPNGRYCYKESNTISLITSQNAFLIRAKVLTQRAIGEVPAYTVLRVCYDRKRVVYIKVYRRLYRMN